MSSSTLKRIQSAVFWFLFAALFYLVNHVYGRGSWPDVKLYSDYSQNILAGRIPYIDFTVEYPPGAFLAMIGPQLFAQGNIDHYQNLFVAENLLLVFIGAILVTDLWQGIDYVKIKQFVQENLRFIALGGVASLLILWLSPLAFFILFILALLWNITQTKALTLELKQTLAAYGMYVFILLPILIWRYDFFVALLTLFTLFFVQRSRPLLAGICLGVGILAKLYPVMMIPPLVLYFVITKAYGKLWRLGMGAIATSVIFLLPFLLIDPTKTFVFLQYHQERPLQIESLPSGIALGLSHLNLFTVEPIATHYSLGLTFAGDRIVLAALPLLFLGLCCAGSYWLWRLYRSQYQETGAIAFSLLTEGCLLMHLIFMVSNKVFSPQYIIWLIPFVVFSRVWERFTFLTVCLLTLLLFPTFYGALTESIWVSSLLNIRNILLVVWGILIVRQGNPTALID